MKQLIYQDTLFEKIPIGITNGKYQLIECLANQADAIIIQHHYSHKATPNRFKSFLVNDNQGAIQLGYGIRPHMKHTISKLITKNNYCEFDRMWLSDELPKFAESQAISLLLSYLKQTCPQIKFVITYADGSVGNTGVIYKATNAIQLTPHSCDFYILPSGERVHPVSMWHRHKTRAIATLKNIYPGIKHIKGDQYQQYRFLYVLDKKLKKKVLTELNQHAT